MLGIAVPQLKGSPGFGDSFGDALGRGELWVHGVGGWQVMRLGGAGSLSVCTECQAFSEVTKRRYN